MRLLRELVHVEIEFERLFIRQEIVPGNHTPTVRRHSSHDRRPGSLNPELNLIVILAGCDAFDETPIFLAIRMSKIIRESAILREPGGCVRWRRLGIFPL